MSAGASEQGEGIVMFRIDMLPAEFGDALWIEYGSKRKTYRILVDCGTSAVYPVIRQRLQALPAAKRHIELLVISHIDIDHIGGSLDLLREAKTLGVSFGEIWFNGYIHLTPGGKVQQDDDTLGPLQGEELTELIVASGASNWNKVVKGGALVVPETGPLQAFPSLPGGMKLTLLSPTQIELNRLKPTWDAACRKAGIVPGRATLEDIERLEEHDEAPEENDTLGDPNVVHLAASPFRSDRARPNGSSIALLAEYGGRRVILGADAYAPVLGASLARLPDSGMGRMKIDAFKIPHHASRGNISAELIAAVDCRNWLVSTNGKVFGHPDQEAIARVIHGSGPGCVLHFNYRTEFNDIWAGSSLQRKHGFKTFYPAKPDGGIRIELAD